MTHVAPLPAEHARRIAITRTIGKVCRTPVVATRTWVLHPPEHPAVALALERLRRALSEAAAGTELQLAVMPDGLGEYPRAAVESVDPEAVGVDPATVS